MILGLVAHFMRFSIGLSLAQAASENTLHEAVVRLFVCDAILHTLIATAIVSGLILAVHAILDHWHQRRLFAIGFSLVTVTVVAVLLHKIDYYNTFASIVSGLSYSLWPSIFAGFPDLAIAVGIVGTVAVVVILSFLVLALPVLVAAIIVSACHVFRTEP